MALSRLQRVAYILRENRKKRVAAAAALPDPESDFSVLIATPHVFGTIINNGTTGNLTSTGIAKLSVSYSVDVGVNDLVVNFGAFSVNLTGTLAGIEVVTTDDVVVDDLINVVFPVGCPLGTLTIKVVDDDPTPGAVFTIATAQLSTI